MVKQIGKFINWINRNVEIDAQIEVTGSDTWSVEVELSVAAELTENEYIWSDFYNRAFPVGSLRYSHTDSNGIAGYRVAGTNLVLWRDQMASVAFVQAA